MYRFRRRRVKPEKKNAKKLRTLFERGTAFFFCIHSQAFSSATKAREIRLPRGGGGVIGGAEGQCRRPVRVATRVRLRWEPRPDRFLTCRHTAAPGPDPLAVFTSRGGARAPGRTGGARQLNGSSGAQGFFYFIFDPVESHTYYYCSYYYYYYYYCVKDARFRFLQSAPGTLLLNSFVSRRTFARP